MKKILNALAVGLTATIPLTIVTSCNTNKSTTENTHISYDSSQEIKLNLKGGEKSTLYINLDRSDYKTEDFKVKLLKTNSNNANGEEEFTDISTSWIANGKQLLLTLKKNTKNYSAETVNFNIQIKTNEWTETIKNCSIYMPEELEQSEEKFDYTYNIFRQNFFKNLETYKEYNYFGVDEQNDYICDIFGDCYYLIPGNIYIEADQQTGKYYYTYELDLGVMWYWMRNELFSETLDEFKQNKKEYLEPRDLTIEYYASEHNLTYVYKDSDNNIIQFETYNETGHLVRLWNDGTFSTQMSIHLSNFCKK